MRYLIIACAAVWLAGACGMCAQAQGVLDEITLTEPAGTDRAGEGLAVVDVTGILSMDRHRSSTNVVILLWVGPHNTVNGIGWDVVLETLIPGSFYSDTGVLITNTALQPVPNFGFKPGGAFNESGGPRPFAREMFKFADLDLPGVQALADGLIRLEFFDTPDQMAGQPDGRWVSGTLTFQTINPIPEPVSAGLLALYSLAVLPTRRIRNRSQRP